MTSIVKLPSYMKNFNCIAAKCEETCCAGWYIAIDEATLKKYKKVKHPEMKKRLDKELVVKRGAQTAKIKLKNNRCAFLNQHNLCDIYAQLGESYLSETCKMYPRNTNRIGEKVELSLALSCPEAARLILLHEGPITFEEQPYESLPIVGADLKLNLKQPKQFEDYMIQMRDLLIEVLQEESLSFEQKWCCLEEMMVKLERFKQRQELKKMAEYLDQMKDTGFLKLKRERLSKETEEILSSRSAKKLFEILVNMREAKKWPSARYEECFTQMVKGLSEVFDEKKYAAGEKVYKTVFVKEYSGMLENYFVNYIYERLVPINQSSPFESFKMMNLYLALIKLHLAGLLAQQEGIMQPEQAVACIQSFTRVFDHNELYIEQIKKQLTNSKSKGRK